MADTNDSEERLRRAMEFAYDRGRRDTIDALHRHSEARDMSIRMMNPYSTGPVEGERWMVRCKNSGCKDIIDESDKGNPDRPTTYPRTGTQWWKDTDFTAYCPKHWRKPSSGKVFPKEDEGE